MKLFLLNVSRETLMINSKLKQVSDKKYIMKNLNNFTINCKTDDIESFVYPSIGIAFEINCDLTITNKYLKDNNFITETTTINGNTSKEIISIDSANKIITSSDKSKIFGKKFNWVWPRLYYGSNDFTLNVSIGNTSQYPIVTVSYRYPIKYGQF